MIRCSTPWPVRAWATPSPLPGPDDGHPGAVEPTGSAGGGQGDGAVRQRRDAPGDGRLRSDALAGLDGVAEQGAEDGTGGVFGLGPPGPAHLAEDLGLAQDGGVESGGDREEVAR